MSHTCLLELFGASFFSLLVGIHADVLCFCWVAVFCSFRISNSTCSGKLCIKLCHSTLQSFSNRKYIFNYFIRSNCTITNINKWLFPFPRVTPIISVEQQIFSHDLELSSFWLCWTVWMLLPNNLHHDFCFFFSCFLFSENGLKQDFVLLSEPFIADLILPLEPTRASTSSSIIPES